MAATWKWYGQALAHLAAGDIDFDGDTFKVLLTTSSYTPDQDADEYRDDVTNEVTGTGYTAGGEETTVSVSYDSGTNQLRITCTDVEWENSSITNARTAVLYKARGGSADADELIAFATNDANVSSVGATFTVDMPSPTLTITAS